MEQPPRFVKREDLQDFFFSALTAEKTFKRIIVLLRKGATAESLARTFLYTGVIEGLYTPDLMLLTARDVYYLVLAIARVGGVDNVKAKNPDEEYEEFMETLLPTLEEEGAAIDTPEEKFAAGIFSGLSDISSTPEEPIMKIEGFE
jgi:hypothetical protein